MTGSCGVWCRCLPAAVAVGLLLSACGGESTPPEVRTRSRPEYVGGEVCVSCHRDESRRWSNSHHDLAMQEATSATVLGDFEGAEFTFAGVTTTFSRQGDRFFVRTDGPDGELHDYEVAFTFGVTPLQQYLVEFPGGRFQALSICWDTRPAAEGGQRWFHLYPEEEIVAGDPLHWTGPLHNWNYMCAECHSTNLRKNYRQAGDLYETTWSEIDVSCEACHGPASEHVAWARTGVGEGDRGASDHFGLAVRLEDPGRGTWMVDPETDTGMRLEPPPADIRELETCARCHSRRASISDAYAHGGPLADTHRMAWLEEGLYHADGQVLDEVYVYGSFVQSRMYAAGVTCSDCHDPHGLNLRFPGNGVCARCHTASKFDSENHHFHREGTEGSMCVDCHMPPETYMVVDPRHDHSLRIPRPDLSLTLGTPNACNDCHQDRSVDWAVERVTEWYGPGRRAEPGYGGALHAGRTGQVDAESRLVALLQATDEPAIARASAAELLARYLSPRSVGALQASLADSAPQVRRAAVTTLAALEPTARWRLVSPLLRDPIRAVRIQAAQVLVDGAGDSTRPALDRALKEYEAAQRFNADRAENRLNLAWLYSVRNRPGEAEGEYLRALEMAPWLPVAYINLADFYADQDRENEGERVLRLGLQTVADSAGVHHALALSLVRQQRMSEAMEHFRRATELEPERARYAYVYGVALHSAGQVDEALSVLAAAHDRAPGDREVLLALVTMHRDGGDVEQARRYVKDLLVLVPEDPSVHQLASQLGAVSD